MPLQNNNSSLIQIERIIYNYIYKQNVINTNNMNTTDFQTRTV